MVDFQSRDTSRGYASDEDEEEDDEDGADSDRADDSEVEETEVDAPDAGGTEARGTEIGGNESGETESEGTEAGTVAEAGSGEVAEAGSGDAPNAESAVTDQAERSGDEGAPGGEGHEQTNHEQDQHERDHPERDHHGHEHDGHDHDAHSHDHHHANLAPLGVAVITVSSTRGPENDPSGDAIRELVVEDDHNVVSRDVVADDLDGIQRTVLALTAREDVDVVVTTGGTGVTPDDVTIEAVEPLFDKELPGFGELFRVLSYESVGTRALGSRATAGVSEGVPVFCLPGSEDAARLGTEELVLAEMAHLVELARRDDR